MPRRCGPSRSTPAPRSASGSSFAQNAQNPPKRGGIDVVVDAHAGPRAEFDFDDARPRSASAAGIPISSSIIDEAGLPQLLTRGEQTVRTVTGSGGRLHLGMVAGIKSERRPASNRKSRPD
jgi:hypothetical protein